MEQARLLYRHGWVSNRITMSTLITLLVKFACDVEGNSTWGHAIAAFRPENKSLVLVKSERCDTDTELGAWQIWKVMM